MSYFDNIVFDENTLLEGKQAEEYLKKKQDKINNEREKDIARYGKTRIYNVDQDKEYIKGSRSAQTPTWDTHRSNYADGSRDNIRNHTNSDHDYVKRNPRYKDVETHRNRMRELKNKYPDAMPKNTETKLDKEYDKAQKKRTDELMYANKVASKYADKNASGHYPGDSQVATSKYAQAADAARRHYRRTHKEAAEMLEAYNPELIEL